MTSRALAMNARVPYFGGAGGWKRSTGSSSHVFHVPARTWIGCPVEPGGGSQCSGPRGRLPFYLRV